jgi:hypothetical protein
MKEAKKDARLMTARERERERAGIHAEIESRARIATLAAAQAYAKKAAATELPALEWARIRALDARLDELLAADAEEFAARTEACHA